MKLFLNPRLTCSGVPDACFIRGPPGVAEDLRCDVADALSCLMVRGSEELVSRVIRIGVKDGARLPFPVSVVVPFCGSYRGSYRDVVVKMVDEEGRSSYVAPLATEGTYGGQWVKFCSRSEFAVARTGSLSELVSSLWSCDVSSSGLVCRGASVLSGPVRCCFLSENRELHSSYKGLVVQAEHGPPDLSELPPRMLCSPSHRTNNGTVTEVQLYSPCDTAWQLFMVGSGPERELKKRSERLMFSQIQPMDTTLLAAAKSRTDAYHSVVCTSPVLYLTHPSSQRLRRPLTLILPCPPNLQKKKHEGEQEESAKQSCRDKPAPQRR